MNQTPGHFLMVVLICLAIAVPIVYGQALDEWSRVRGTIVDADNAPIAETLVEITHESMGREYSWKTKRKGQFSCNRIMPGTYSYLVSKEGYKSVSGLFTVIPKSRQTLEILLVMETPGEAITQKRAIDLYNEGVELSWSGKTDEAIQKLEESIDLNPEIGNAHYNLGVLLLEKDRTDEAEIALLNALELDPKIEMAGVALAELYFQQGNTLVDRDQFDVAFDVLSEAFSFDSEHPQVNYLLGLLCVRKSDDGNALRYFENYLRLAPDSDHSAEVKSALEKLLDGS